MKKILFASAIIVASVITTALSFGKQEDASKMSAKVEKVNFTQTASEAPHADIGTAD